MTNASATRRAQQTGEMKKEIRREKKKQLFCADNLPGAECLRARVTRETGTLYSFNFLHQFLPPFQLTYTNTHTHTHPVTAVFTTFSSVVFFFFCARCAFLFYIFLIYENFFLFFIFFFVNNHHFWFSVSHNLLPLFKWIFWITVLWPAFYSHKNPFIYFVQSKHSYHIFCYFFFFFCFVFCFYVCW